jgi:nucleoid-associated protein YgaU
MAPIPGQRYTIQAGDTLFDIATAAYGADNANTGGIVIENSNPGINPTDLQPGQEILIGILNPLGPGQAAP